MAAIIPSTAMARVISRRVKPPVAARPVVETRRTSLRLGRRPQAVQGVRLRPGAVLPAHLDLETAQRDVGVEVEVLLVDPVLLGGMAYENMELVPLGGDPVLAVVGELGGVDEGVHGGAREQDRPALARRHVLEPEAAAEDLQAGDQADGEHGQGNRDLEQREPAVPPPAHQEASPTCTRPISGSSSTRNRFWKRSRRLARITSAPLVLPLGKNRTWTDPLPRTAPPSTRSRTARSVSSAQRPPVVSIRLLSGSMISSW